MDIVRQKLCKDLGVLEVLKGEIEKAGTGSLREELEQDFHDEYMAYIATLMKQKEKVEVMQERKKAAIQQLEGITWTDSVLEGREDELVVSS